MGPLAYAFLFFGGVGVPSEFLFSLPITRTLALVAWIILVTPINFLTFFSWKSHAWLTLKWHIDVILTPRLLVAMIIQKPELFVELSLQLNSCNRSNFVILIWINFNNKYINMYQRFFNAWHTEIGVIYNNLFSISLHFYAIITFKTFNKVCLKTP